MAAMTSPVFQPMPEAEVRAHLRTDTAEALIEQGAKQMKMHPSQLEVFPVVCMPQHKTSEAYHEWTRTTSSASKTVGTIVMNPVRFVQTFHSAADSNPIKTWMECMKIRGHPSPSHIAWAAVPKQ